eukprot:851556-Rhodomonas_salina.2
MGATRLFLFRYQVLTPSRTRTVPVRYCSTTPLRREKGAAAVLSPNVHARGAEDALPHARNFGPQQRVRSTHWVPKHTAIRTLLLLYYALPGYHGSVPWMRISDL